MEQSASPTVDWYVARGAEKEGPYSLAAVRSMLANGRLTGTDLVWKLGGTEWRRVDQVGELVPPPPPSSTQIRGDLVADSASIVFPSIDSIALPAPASVSRQTSPPAPITNSPWNPSTILVLAVLFTPMWAGVMAAMNGLRLRSQRSVWMPLAIGFGYIGVSIAQSAVVDSIFLDWIVFLGAAAILWIAALQHQFPLFQNPRQRLAREADPRPPAADSKGPWDRRKFRRHRPQRSVSSNVRNHSPGGSDPIENSIGFVSWASGGDGSGNRDVALS
jgi:GYF domain 2